jgi:uncharacterized protein (TIGR01244 family)
MVSCAAAKQEAMKIEIPNAVWVADGILSGGQPDADQLRRAGEAGFKTIINLRGAGEEGSLDNEAELVRALNMDYISIPLADGSDLSEEKARQLASALAGSEALPAMVHCRSGNRVGILFALKAFLVDGVEPDEALTFGKAAGMRRVPARLEEFLADEPGD